MRSPASGLPLPLLAAILLAPTPAPFPAPGPDVSGAPLSPAEYERFFSALTPIWKAEIACRLRATQGCQNHKLVQLDQYENHGTLPQGERPLRLEAETDRESEARGSAGSVCTDLPFASWFESFCQFTQYRCANRLYYAKRVLCFPSPSLLSSPETFTRMDSTTVPFSLPHVTTAEKVRPETYLPWSEQIYTDVKDLLQSSLSMEKKGSKARIESPTPPSTRQVRKKHFHPAVIEGIRELIRSAQVLGSQNKITQVDEDDSFESLFCLQVCDSFGRRHLETCQHCAFCSLKLEQCQSEVPLMREPCSENHMEEFLSPLLSAQDTTLGIEVGPRMEGQYYGLDLYGGLGMDFWCGQLATKGCEDTRVSNWLQTEFLSFQDGDYPYKICDSDYIQYPNYCAFKSHQCLLRNQDKKVFRMRCLKNETYSVLNVAKGEEAILLWSQKFSSLSLGHGG
ncbi:acrosin-binding protein isoform 6-T6 [Sarcophilus harrisii]